MTNTIVPRRRFRFSLRAILLAIVIVALCVAQFASVRRERDVSAINQQLSVENKELRREAGYLTVDDPSKVCVLQLPDLDALTWRWKIHLPAGEWTLHAQVRDIPTKGLTQSVEQCRITGPRSQFLIAASVRKDAAGTWQLVTQTETSSHHMGLGDAHRLIADEDRNHGSVSAGKGCQQSFDGHQPVELLRLRTLESQTSSGGRTSRESPSPADGILIWIERRK